jgi:RND family efflux transporter MFP subunit
VQSIHVDAGDRVEQGDVLLELDGKLTRLELERLLARREELTLAYEDARRLADEGRRLIDDRNISKSQYESRLATEAGEETRLRQLESQVRAQQALVERHYLRAPFSGVIGAKNTEVGQWLNAGNHALLLVQLDPLRVQANVPERYFDEVRPGTAVTVSVDAYPGRTIAARVESVVPVTDFNTRSFKARMDIPNKGNPRGPCCRSRRTPSYAASTAVQWSGWFMTVSRTRCRSPWAGAAGNGWKSAPMTSRKATWPSPWVTRACGRVSKPSSHRIDFRP